MRIKPLIISLIALGFVSGSAFAVEKAAGKAVVKKKPVKVEAVNKNVDGTAATANVVPTEVKKSDSRAQAVVDQNAFNNTTNSVNWADRVTVGGFANADLVWSDHEPLSSFAPSGSVVDLYIPNANLLFDAKINEWSALHFNLVYSGAPNVSGTVKVPGSSTVNVADGYVTISDLSRTPFYTRVGVQYLPFGDYQRYPMLYTMAQLMEEVSQPSLVIGMVNDDGLYAQVYGFNGPTKKATEAKYTMRNFGAKVGYYGELMQDTKYNVDVAWIRNIYDATFFTDNFMTTTAGVNHITDGRNAVNPVGAMSAHLDVATGAFDFNANCVTTFHSMVQSIAHYTSLTSYTTNSRLWAADIGAGYSFKTMDYNSRVAIGYQQSGHGEFTADLFTPAEVSFPQYAFTANYTVDIMKNTVLGFAVEHDRSYDYRSTYSSIHGTNLSGTRNANLAMTRLSFKF